MNKYKNLHLWMIIPMIFMQLGIFMDYWGDFIDNAWSVHIHYWTGTIWYLYLIIQPYYSSHGQLEKHRTNGIIGMFLAGGVSLTAFSMLFRDLESAARSMEMPDQFGPFEPWFFHGVAAVEILMMIAFGFAVIKSIIHRKQLEDHSWWLISTVFIIMMPALGRGVQNLFIIVQVDNWPDIDIMTPLYLTQFLIIGMVLLAAWKFQKIKHPATYLALGVNIITTFLEPIGKSDLIVHILKSMIKG